MKLHGLLAYLEINSNTRRRATKRIAWKCRIFFGKLGRVDTPNENVLADFDRPVAPTYVPTPDNPPWNGWVAVGVWFASVLFVGIVPLIFLVPYLITQGLDLGDRDRLSEFVRTDSTAVILQLAPIMLAHALTLIVAWFVVTRFNTYSFRQTLGWKMNGFKWWHAILITVGFYALAITLLSLLGDVENEFEILLKTSKYAVYLVAFFATVSAPLVEEVVYRGLLYSAFQRRFGGIIAVIFVTLLFTLVHVPQYSLGAVPDYATVVTLLLLSLSLTLLRAGTGNLLPCIVLHTVFNAIQSVLLVAEPYLKALEPVVEPTAAALFK